MTKIDNSSVIERLRTWGPAPAILRRGADPLSITGLSPIITMVFCTGGLHLYYPRMLGGGGNLLIGDLS